MDSLDEIKKKIDIVEFIGKYVSLQKAGRNFRAPCPFHSEKTPSFIVSPDRQIWHCFGACNEGGDIFKFLMKWDNLTFGEALKTLAEQAGVKISRNTYVDRDWDVKQKLLSINQYAADFYQYLLEKHKLGDKARKYLQSRKVNPQTTHHFYLGYAPKSWDSLLKYLLKKGFSHKEINATGLIIKSDSNRYYDRFRQRLMFPLSDMRGNIVGFSGRLLSTDDKQAKYVNSPETTIYHKRENMFGLHQAANEIRKKDEIIVVEGEFDAILAHQFGYTQTVAIKGSALTNEHLKLIKRLTQKIIFALDMDEAGQEAVRRSINEAEKYDFQMQVLNIESGKDPAEILTNNPQEFAKSYKNKQTIYSYLIDSFAKHQDMESIYGQKAVVEMMLPYLQKIFNPILFDHYLKQLSNVTTISSDTIKKSIFNFRRKVDKKPYTKTKKPEKERKTIEEALENYLLALFVQTDKQLKLLKLVTEELEEADYFSPAVYKLFEQAYKMKAADDKELLTKLEQKLPKELLENYNQGFLYELPNGEIDWNKEIKKTILNIKKYSLKRQIKQLMKTDDEKTLKKILKKLSEVEKTIAIV